MDDTKVQKKPCLLRAAAEAQLGRVPAPAASPRSADELLHELHVHQIELEMQNEELRRAHLALEESRDRYLSLYEFAPVGYLTLTRTGQIAEINLTGAALLGGERANLLQLRFDHFVSPQDRDRWNMMFVGVMAHTEKMGIELALQHGEGSTLYAHLDCLRIEVAGCPAEMRMTLTDISAMLLNQQLSAAQGELIGQSESLRKSEAALRESEERLRKATETARDAIVMIEAEHGIIIEWNPAAEAIFGYAQAEALGRVLHDLLAPSRFREMAQQGLSRFAGTGEGAAINKTVELVALHKNGTEFPIELSLSAMQLHGKWHATGIVRDISARKRAEAELCALKDSLEARVTERTAQLEAANKELEAFSYSVSHDLRSPLRIIDGFSHILLDDYADKLEDEGKRLLNVVRDNSSRMEQLIDDILKFSRTSRLEMSFSEIDMERLAHEVAEEIQPVVADGKLQLEIEHLPPAQGDRPMMRQVFVNLLSNAVKFSRHKEPALIRVGASVKGDEAIYYVKDNGAGFDMKYADKLFGVFQRLHSTNEFEGTGIGLAIVNRIITRHGGRVWAEGRVNEGATIYFALPAKERIHE